MLRKVAIAGIITAVIVTTPAFAHDGHSHDSTTETDKTTSKDEKSNNKTKSKNDASDVKTKRQERSKKSQESREFQRDNDGINKKSETKKSKLEGRRLAQCENRQKNINTSMAKSNGTSKDRLIRIQQYEAKVRAFYAKQTLSSNVYDAISTKVDQSELSAIAAVDTYSKLVFDCNKTDADNPSDAIKTAGSAKRMALKQYREDVKALLKVVKQEFEASKAASTRSDT